MKALAIAVSLLLGATLCHARPLSTDEALALPTTEVEANLPDSHPAVLYAYAKRLFAQEQNRNDAVMWFYAGQLRFRFLLAVQPARPPDREAGIMASLNATIGQTLNEWAGGSPQDWAAAIDQALAWDAAHGNAITSQQTHEKAWQDTRSGLAALRDSILANAQDIRKQRAQRGLENR